MNTLLEALQEGRLIELPENDKGHALQFLAHIIEAIPSVPFCACASPMAKTSGPVSNTLANAAWGVGNRRHSRAPQASGSRVGPAEAVAAGG